MHTSHRSATPAHILPAPGIAALHIIATVMCFIIVPKPDDVSHQNKARRTVHIGIIRVLLSDRSDMFTLPLAAGSVCFDFLLSPLAVASIVCIYRIS